MFGYRVPAPDDAMLISGGKGSGGAPFRVVVGHGQLVMPLFRKVRYLTLAMQEAEVTEQCVTKQGIALNVRAVIAFKVGNDPESIINAGQRFLSDEQQMPTLTGRIFAGHLRSIVGSMTVEEIVTQRQRLAEEVLEGSKVEMGHLGLTVDSLQIQSIDDLGSGYIDLMAAPHQAAIRQQAKAAQAAADRGAAEAEQKSQQQQALYAQQTAVVRAQAEALVSEAEQVTARQQVEFQRQTAIARARAKAEVDQAQAEADQAGPLTQAESQVEVATAQAALAAKQAALRQQQLVAEVIRPAEAEAQKVRVLAEADAARTKLQAEAAASNDRVALDRTLIEQLPDIVTAAAAGLAGANVNVLNGADGLGEIAAGLVSQGLTILDAVKKNLAGTGASPGALSDTGKSPGKARR